MISAAFFTSNFSDIIPDIIIVVDKGERMFYYHYEHSFPVRFITWKGHLWKIIT